MPWSCREHAALQLLGPVLENDGDNGRCVWCKAPHAYATLPWFRDATISAIVEGIVLERCGIEVDAETG